MKKKIIIFIAISLPIISLFTMWVINKYINEKTFNEQKAELYDKYMNSSYYYLNDMQNATSVLLDYTKTKADRAYSLNKNNFNSEFFKQFFDSLKYDDNAWKAMNVFEELDFESFIGSPVFRYLMDGSKYRKKEAEAVYTISNAYLTFQYMLHHNYEDINDEVEIIDKEFKESRETLHKYDKTANKDRFAWQNIDTIEQVNILQRYNERKNWPFKK